VGKAELIIRYKDGQALIATVDAGKVVICREGSFDPEIEAYCELELTEELQEYLDNELVSSEPGDPPVEIWVDGRMALTYDCVFEIHHALQHCLEEVFCKLREDEDSVFWTVNKYSD